MILPRSMLLIIIRWSAIESVSLNKSTVFETFCTSFATGEESRGYRGEIVHEFAARTKLALQFPKRQLLQLARVLTISLNQSS